MAKFAFYAVSNVDNAYYIKCTTTNQWVTYDQSDLGEGSEKISFVDDKPTIYWQITTTASEEIIDGVTIPSGSLLIAPCNSEGTAQEVYWNWHGGIGYTYTADGTKTIGFYGNPSSASGDYWVAATAPTSYTYAVTAPEGVTITVESQSYKNGDNITISTALKNSDVTISDTYYSKPVVAVTSTTITVTIPNSAPTLSTADSKTYYTIRNNKNSSFYAQYNGTSNFMNSSTSRNDANVFYFTQSEDTESTTQKLAVNIHATVAGDNQLTDFNSWGTDAKVWYIQDDSYTTATTDHIISIDGKELTDKESSWNSYSQEKIGPWKSSDGDKGSAWYIEKVTNEATEYTVAVSGLSDTDKANAGFTFAGNTYKDGDKLTLCFESASVPMMEAIAVEGYTAQISGYKYGKSLRVAYTKTIVPTTVSEGAFAADTKWYTIKSKAGNYIATDRTTTFTEDETEYTGYKADDSTYPTSNAGMWCVTYDETNGYQFYNKATGASKVLANVATGDDKKAIITEETTDSKSYYNMIAAPVAGYWCIQEKNSINDYWNIRDGVLSTWSGGSACVWGWNGTQANCVWNWGNGDDGSQYSIEEAYIYTITITPNGAEGTLKATVNSVEYESGATYYGKASAGLTVTATVATGYIYTVNVDESAKTITITYNAIPFDATKKYALKSASGTYLVLDTEDNNGVGGATATAASYGTTPTLFTIAQNGNAYTFQDASNSNHYIGVVGGSTYWWNVKNTASADWNITASDDSYIISQKDKTSDCYLGNKDNTTSSTGIYNDQPNPIKWYIVEAAKANMRLTSAEWGTFCAPFDVTIPDENIKAYTGEVSTKDWIKLTEIEGETIPANTAVVVYKQGVGDAESYDFVDVISDEEGQESCFTGNTGDITAVAEGDYILQNNNNIVGWYQVSSETPVTIGKNRCYLEAKNVPNSARASYLMSFDGEATGINNIAVEAATKADGKYLVNGKMVVVKAGKAYNMNGQVVK